MASHFVLTLDTAAPAGVSVVINNNDLYTSQQLVNLAITCTDADTTGYQMLIWGSVDTAFDTNIKATEATSSWMSFATTKQIKLSSGDGLKTIYLRVRDDVLNVSAQVSDTITLNTAIPVVTISAGPDVARISKQPGRDAAAFSFQSDVAFLEYMVRVVPATNSAYTAGTLIGTANGSTNMSGTGTFSANTNINSTIKGADLGAASAGDGNKIIKVFVKSQSGIWST